MVGPTHNGRDTVTPLPCHLKRCPCFAAVHHASSSPTRPSGRVIVDDECFLEYVGQQGDKLLMRGLVKILLL